jgi:hypothetical protein
MGFTPPQENTGIGEYQLKAVFLYNFTQFVEWPEEVFAESDSPLVIGILGKDPFGSYLEEIVQGEARNGHAILVQRYSNVKQIINCHILFIEPAFTSKEEIVLKELKDKKILTVSDGNNFIKHGGMIRFANERNKIKLQINLSAVRKSDITISSKLLRLSEIIEEN